MSDIEPELAAATLAPVHPGEDLLRECLLPLGVAQKTLADAIRVPPRQISKIIRGKSRITADTALRLARYFGTTDRFWLNLQAHYELEIGRIKLGGTLDEIRPLRRE